MFGKKKITELESQLKAVQEENSKLRAELAQPQEEQMPEPKVICVKVSPNLGGLNLSNKGREHVFDKLTNQVLFEKLGGSLPLVFDYNHPISIYPFPVWLSKIKRDDLISTYNDEIKSYFEEMKLSEIKEKFHDQLFDYYKRRVANVLEEHNKILYKHYHHDSEQSDDKRDDSTDGGNK